MAKCDWPGSMLEEHKVPAELVKFFQTIFEESQEKSEKYAELSADFRMLENTCARQDRYIAELEKQLSLLQKTLDLVDKNRGVDNG